MKYKVIYTNLLVEVISEKQDAIINPEKSTVVRARVREIGEGRTAEGNRCPMWIRPDMLVWFSIFDATEFPQLPNHYVLPQTAILVYEED